MLHIRKSETRGATNLGWLQSQHTFSFGSFYDPAAMGFSALRVINDDSVIAGEGFATHGHRDMEILSYVVNGEIAHKDSEGNIKTLPAGEFQLMSAGSGIQHSEYNPSASESLRFLQIWIKPDTTGQAPEYQQKYFGRANGLTLIASPDGDAESMRIKQQAKIYQLYLDAQQVLTLELKAERQLYLHLVDGTLLIAPESGKVATIYPGDGVEIKNTNTLQLQASEHPVMALVFDLP